MDGSLTILEHLRRVLREMGDLAIARVAQHGAGSNRMASRLVDGGVSVSSLKPTLRALSALRRIARYALEILCVSLPQPPLEPTTLVRSSEQMFAF